VFLYAFDLVELDGDDLRRDPLALHKATLASLLARAAPGLHFNEHLDEHSAPSSASRLTAGAAGFLIQSCVCPER
jgi:ATP-dependent DNA ligase